MNIKDQSSPVVQSTNLVKQLRTAVIKGRYSSTKVLGTRILCSCQSTSMAGILKVVADLEGVPWNPTLGWTSY